MANVHYALCVTSCNRHDLLRVTIDSFMNAGCGGINPRCTIICEDSDTPMPEWLKDHKYASRLGKITWLQNESRRGQVYTVDRLVAAIPKDIERVLWLEDDWQCDRGGFANEALEILDKYPKISQVILHNDWGQPLIDQPLFEGFKVAMPYWHKHWGGWSFNPTFTRVETIKQFGTYASQAAFVNGLKHEEVFSKKFLDAGYRRAALPHYFHHIGGGRSRSVEPLST